MSEKDETKPRIPTDASEPLMQWFSYDHLPEPLREVSRHFAQLAHWTVDNLPRNAERTVALRKLLEGKDAAVRAMLVA